MFGIYVCIFTFPLCSPYFKKRQSCIFRSWLASRMDARSAGWRRWKVNVGRGRGERVLVSPVCQSPRACLLSGKKQRARGFAERPPTEAANGKAAKPAGSLRIGWQSQLPSGIEKEDEGARGGGGGLRRSRSKNAYGAHLPLSSIGSFLPRFTQRCFSSNTSDTCRMAAMQFEYSSGHW